MRAPGDGALVSAFAAVLFMLAVLYAYRPDLVNPVAVLGDAGGTASQAVLAAAASATGAESGCVQKPDGWTQPRHDKIPGTIFISLASYRDDECKGTVTDAFDKAAHPDNVYVGVCQQNKEQEEDCFDRCQTCAMRKDSGHIRVINYDYLSARGPTFARREASKLWRGEEFYLQIDSHIQFEKDWDVTLIEQMRATGDARAVVGSYPPTPEQMADMRANGFSTMITMGPGPFDKHGLPSIKAEVVPTNGRTAPVPTAFQPAGCMCMPGEALYSVPFDPYLSYLFFGEEVLFSARLWTAGFNLYAPARHFCVHNYGREGKPKYWQDHAQSEPCKRKALQRVKLLLGTAPSASVHSDYLRDADAYGMGTERSLADYQRHAGVDLVSKTVSKSCPVPLHQ